MVQIYVYRAKDRPNPHGGSLGSTNTPDTIGMEPDIWLNSIDDRVENDQELTDTRAPLDSCPVSNEFGGQKPPSPIYGWILDKSESLYL